MIRVGSIVFRVVDLERRAAFWDAALNYARRRNDGESDAMVPRKRRNRPADSGAGPRSGSGGRPARASTRVAGQHRFIRCDA
jgi:hypothetical protein